MGLAITIKDEKNLQFLKKIINAKGKLKNERVLLTSLSLTTLAPKIQSSSEEAK